jgi:hypothetical protein
MNPPVPEVTVLIHRIRKDHWAGEYRLHIKKVLNYKHWDAAAEAETVSFKSGGVKLTDLGRCVNSSV